MKTIIKKFSCLFFLIICFLPQAALLHGRDQTTSLKVIAELANIRENPDIGSAILIQIPHGTIVDSDERTGDWYRISFPGENDRPRTGYVHESLVQPMSDPFRKKLDPVPAIQEPEMIPESPPPIRRPASPKQIAPGRKEGNPVFTIAFSGGGFYLSGGDLNTGLQGLADYYRISLGSSSDENPEPIHLSAVVGGDILFGITPVFSVGLGADYIIGKKKSSVVYAEDPLAWTLTAQPEIKALPVRFALIFHPQPFISFKAGIEYIFAQCRYAYRMESGETWEEWIGNATSGGLGLTAGIGVDQKVTPFASLFCELFARYARISSFEGTSEYRASSGLESAEDGFLYSYQGEVTEGTTYPLLFIREREPTEAGVSEVEKAVLDLSGFGFRLGIKFRF